MENTTNNIANDDGKNAAHQTACVKVMTKAEWSMTHSDYKTTIDGQKFVLSLVSGKGTCLVPVEIKKENTRREAGEALHKLRGFLGAAQLAAIGQACYGEEKQFFYDKVVELDGIVETMPKTYETDGQGLDAIAHLHYFTADCDWYITEKDMEAEQLQAFGLAKVWESELGYISIVELLKNGAELDLSWTPKALRDIK